MGEIYVVVPRVADDRLHLLAGKLRQSCFLARLGCASRLETRVVEASEARAADAIWKVAWEKTACPLS